MMEADKLDGWVRGMIAKRPETALVLHALLLRLRERGECTAEDAHGIAVSHPNVRGTAMKLLRKCGAVKTVPTTGTTSRSHGHVLFVWKVEDYELLRGVLGKLGSLVTGIERTEDRQTLLDLVI